MSMTIRAGGGHTYVIARRQPNGALLLVEHNGHGVAPGSTITVLGADSPLEIVEALRGGYSIRNLQGVASSLRLRAPGDPAAAEALVVVEAELARTGAAA